MTEQPAWYPEQENKPRITRAQMSRLLLVTGLMIIGLWLAFFIAQLNATIEALQLNLQQAEEIVDAGVLSTEPAQIENLVDDLRANVLDLKRLVGPFAWLGPLFSWVPRYGPVLAGASDLLIIADSGSLAGVHLVRGLMPVLVALHSEQSITPLALIANYIPAANDDLKLAAQALAQVDQARVNIEGETLPDQIQDLLNLIDSGEPLAQDFLTLGPVIPDLLGLNGQKTYLILAQNEDELRPSGGFISGAGIITVAEGNITSVSFQNANLIDDWQNKPYNLPPVPFTEFMGMDIFLFRDANFWPEFPRSAQEAMALYSYGQDVQLDGAIAINQKFLQNLLSATGPVDVPELGYQVTTTNVIPAIREEWGPAGGQEDWINQRKAFMGPLALALSSKLTGDFESVDLLSLIRVVREAVEARDLQIYVPDAEIATVLAEVGWDGALSNQQNQDYLMVVDSNLGFNKANAAVKRQLTYSVSLHSNQQGLADLRVRYTHTGTGLNQVCDPGTTYNDSTQYEDLIEDCYWNYLRVFVPEDSKLVSSTTNPVSSDFLLVDSDWDGNTRVKYDEGNRLTYFDNFFVLPPGQESTFQFEYMLPQVVHSDASGTYHYILTIDRQSGAGQDPIEISIQLPIETKLVNSNPKPSNIIGSTIIYELVLATDKEIEIEYR